MSTYGIGALIIGLLVLGTLATRSTAAAQDRDLFGAVANLYDCTPRVLNIAHAIAHAEGFLVSGSKPQRYNNPCSISDSNGLIFYDSLNDGWRAACHQIDLIVTGRSGVYRAEMPIIQIAGIYTLGRTDAENVPSVIGWARVVAADLGLSINDPLTEAPNV
jgi:hypothetical protein